MPKKKKPWLPARRRNPVFWLWNGMPATTRNASKNLPRPATFQSKIRKIVMPRGKSRLRASTISKAVLGLWKAK